MRNNVQYYLKPFLFFSIMFLSLLTFGIVAQRIVHTNRVNYEESVSNEIVADIHNHFNSYILKIESMNNFVDENKISGIDNDEFYLFASGLFDHDESLENISIAPNGIHEFVYPEEENFILGYNLLEDEREQVIEKINQAIDNKEVVVSGPYPNRTNSEITIMVIRYPVYYDNGDFYGLINVVLKTSILFEPHHSSLYDDIDYNIINENNDIVYGTELIDPIEKVSGIELGYFDWTVNFGRSQSYFERINTENRTADIVFFIVVFIGLIGGAIFVKYSGNIKKEEEKHSLELTRASYHDSLTGLYNRRFYEKSIIELDEQNNYPLTLVLSDINGLKLINDAFGHISGDKLLITASNTLQESLRESDLLARIGGDEFVIIMPKTSGKEASEIIAKINHEISKIFIESIQVSISFGYSTKQNLHEDINDTFRSAEDAMYREKLLEIPSMRSQAIETILNTLYVKDESSEIHSRVVSNISAKLAKVAGLGTQEVKEVKTAGLLHDIGKIILPSTILRKEGKLTPEEYEIVKGHSEIGFRILNSTQDMRSISIIVLNHHERWDGSGYPIGKIGEEIPLQSRIIAIADAFDAMTSERSYRQTFTDIEALEEINLHSGTQFDPKLVKLFHDNFEKIINNNEKK